MTGSTGNSDAGVVDVLYAIALGEGFFAAISEIKQLLAADQFLLLGAGGQTLSRVALGFLIIVVSWLYYRRAIIPGRSYPIPEFAIDIVVMIAYMALMSFVGSPALYYSIIAIIWLLYLLARLASREMSAAYLTFGLAFVAFFAVAAASASVYRDTAAEWPRVILVTVGVASYRLLDLRLRKRFRFEK